MPNLFSKLFRKKKGEVENDLLADHGANTNKSRGKKPVSGRKPSPVKRGKRPGLEGGSASSSPNTNELATNAKIIPTVLSPINSTQNASPEKNQSPFNKKITTSTSVLQQSNTGPAYEFAPSTASTSKTSDRDSPPILGPDDLDALRTTISPSKSGRKNGPDFSQGASGLFAAKSNAISPSSRNSCGPVDLDDEEAAHQDENVMRRQFTAVPVFSMDGIGTHHAHLLPHKHPEDLQDDGSSFNISTDADDTEYENLRRGLGASVLHNTHLDQSVASTYKSDGETIFPNLADEDSQKGDDKAFSSSWDPNSPIHDFPTTTSIPITSTANIPGFMSSSGNSLGFPSHPPAATNGPSFFKKSQTSSRQPPASSARVQNRIDPFNEDFANFADFANFDSQWPDSSMGNKEKSKKSILVAGSSPFDHPGRSLHADLPKTNSSGKSYKIYIETGKIANSTGKVEPAASGGASMSTRETSLTELLAQAKSKSIGRKSGSVNSAPITSSYMLRDSRRPDARSATEGVIPVSSVTDIIHNLDSAAKTKESGSVRSAKDRLKQKRQQKESEDSDEAAESWLFDEVTGALGPKGIAADLESLSGRSQKSGGERSNKSHRSKSKQRSRRSSGESVGSKDSKRSNASRRSRSSRYSHRSTKSYISQMSEQSRSVANDLLRLEMQLAMVGQTQSQMDNGDGKSSIGDNSRGLRSKTPSTTRRTAASNTRRSRVTVLAPPGKLGIILANKADSKGTVVSGVRTSSVLAEKISPGDRIVAIDGEDVSLMTVSEITTIMARKADFERTLTVLTTPRAVANT